MPRQPFLARITLVAMAGVAVVAAPRPSTGAPGDDKKPTTIAAQLSLRRYDLPFGLSDGFAWTRQAAQRKPGPDAVDWPDLTLDGKPVFRAGSTETVALPLRTGGQAMPLFRQPYDHVIQPGSHWLRAMDWRWNRRHLYTTDATARSSNAGEGVDHRYELWAFPVVIRGAGQADVQTVRLQVAGQTVYEKAGPWRSLTLLLPQNEAGKSYELSVNNLPAVAFEAGLLPPTLGNPREDQRRPVNHTITGPSKTITVANLARPETFPNQKAWDADVAALGEPIAPQPEATRSHTLARHLGVDVPRSPLTIYAAALGHGMSGGFWKQSLHGVSGFTGTPPEYAAFLADTGYDVLFDFANGLPNPDKPDSHEQRLVALAEQGIRYGIHYDSAWNRPFLAHPNVAFFSHTLPDWHAPLFRSLQLAAARFARYPNFAGITTGSDNAGYVSYWDWAPPIPDRPWGEALIAFQNADPPRVPLAPSLPSPTPHEKTAANQAPFLEYLARYDQTFAQYGYFARAVREVSPTLLYTTGSFGSSPGGGGPGGWPWASIPGQPMHVDLPLLQAYDWNEKLSSKPLHNVALVDRLRSYFPDKPAWSIVDDFKLHFDRMTRQRTVALVLTRGVQGIGTSFLANPQVTGKRPDILADQKALYAWMRRYGGVYAATEPDPTVGVLYQHPQALLRRIARGSHEGKTTEALFLCHAAGWPAKIITPEELQRGLLPSIKAILLVGLNRFDDAWVWHAGLEKPLQRFVDGGGRILLDHESVCPVPATQTAMEVGDYITQSDRDQTTALLERNAANVAKLSKAMRGIALPLASSADPTLWAVPARAGNTQYVTAVNQQMHDDPKASTVTGSTRRFVTPRAGQLTWNTTRPIYDVRLGRKITSGEAAMVDFTRDAFHWYALPVADVVAPTVIVAPGRDGWYQADARITNAKQVLTGIPLEVRVSRSKAATTVATAAAPAPPTADAATVYGATGTPIRLPLSMTDVGTYAIVVKELLSGRTGSTTVVVRRPAPTAPASTVRHDNPATVSRFRKRADVPLVVALTPPQQADAATRAQADRLVRFYQTQNRNVTLQTLEPGDVIVSLQPVKTPARYPQWKTTNADLVLLGLPASNVLLRDQARGYLLPPEAATIAPGRAWIGVTFSPFVGERQVLNVLAADAAGLTAAVNALVAAP